MHHSEPTWGTALACVVRDNLSVGRADRRMARRCQSHGFIERTCKTQEGVIEGSIAGTSLAFENQKKGPVDKDRRLISQVGVS